MTSLISRSIACVVMIMLLHLSVWATGAKPTASRQIFAAGTQEGRIGITEDSPVDNPADNIFHVNLTKSFEPAATVWLVYELEGVEDYTAVSRSINDQHAAGGYLVKKRRAWAIQREQISAAWLKEGDNVIRFTIPDHARHSYAIRNLRVETEVTVDSGDQGIVITSNKTHFNNLAYVRGFVQGERPVSSVTVDGQVVTFIKGEFESIVSLAERSSCAVSVDIQYADGTRECKELDFSNAQTIDYAYPLNSFVYQAEKFFSLEDAGALTLAGATLQVEKHSLNSAANLSITTLRGIDIPALDAGMVNVTERHEGYRFLPHGSTFKGEVVVKMKFDPNKIPDGYTAQDIRTYFFDEQAHHWVSLPVDSVLAEQGEIWSRTTHFTDMINSIIKVPESPEVAAYNSTSMKGIKAANPTAGVNLINPPQANNTGSASVGYSINIPLGRNGMQPQLGINYNSGGGNSWLGLGWNMAVPAVGIDTRWGVPRYDAAKETETYTMSGEQLTPVAHRGELADRSSGDKQFYPRVEGGFNKIIRHGNSPANYWWEVTDKSGTRYFYGGSPTGLDKQSILRTNEAGDGGNIAQWNLTEVRDLNGNTVKYYYAKVADVGVAGGTVPGYQIYLSRVTYTGFNGSDGAYEVLFTREGGRVDKSISANLGFKQVTGELLKKVEVRFEGKNIRHYELTYKTGEFLKTVLSKLTEFDAAGKKFTEHEFEYYNDVRKNGFKPFSVAQSWTMPGGNAQGDFITNLKGFTDEATALSGNKSSDFSAGVTASVGFNLMVGNKSVSVGGSVGYSESKNKGVVVMLDVNGDGLQDKVYVKGNGLVYNPNLSGAGENEAFGSEKQIIGVDEFFNEKSKTVNYGVEGVFGVFTGLSRSKTTSKTTVYFTDVNGDQLPDIVRNGVVLFNTIDPETGTITFVRTSESTPSKIVAGGAVTSDLVDKGALERERQEAIDKNPLHDMVRMWQAPYAGSIKVTAPVQLLRSDDPKREETPADGVRVAIQVEGQEIWNKVIGADDYSTHQPTLSNISVQKGDRIFFRVGSIDNGSYDSVQWKPIIEYVNKPLDQLDANGNSVYQFSANEDYVLSSAQFITAPINGKVRISGTFHKPRTTDDVRLYIIRTVTDENGNLSPNDTIWSRMLPWHSVVTQLPDTLVNVRDNENYSFKVATETNIDWSALQWMPAMRYVAAEDPDVDLTQTKIEITTVPEYSMLVDVLRVSEAHVVTLKNHQRDTLTAYARLSFLPRSIFETPYSGSLIFSVKKADTLLAKRTLRIVNGKLEGDSTLQVPVRKGDLIYAEYHTADFYLAGGIVMGNVRLKGLEKDTVMMAGLHSAISYDRQDRNDNREDLIFGSLYRGWGHFGWNGNREKATQPIDRNKLKISQKAKDQQKINDDNLSGEDLDAMDTYDATQDDFYMLIASGGDQRWMGFDRFAFITGEGISSSRIGDDDLSIIQFSTGDGTGAPGIDKVTKATTTSFAAGISVVNGNRSEGTSKVLTDFMDMNGDRYPDIVSEKVIQYTDARGGLSAKTLAVSGSSQETKSKTTGIGLSGSQSMVAPKFHNGSKKTSSTTVDAGDAKSAGNISISGSASFAKGESQVNFIHMDINGDGLPDRVYAESRMVALNLGYGFTSPEAWEFTSVQSSTSDTKSGGAGLGFTKGRGSISAGFSLARSDNKSTSSLQDINGDGLPDMVVDGNPVKVRINTGNSFGPEILWNGASAINENATASESANVSFTIGIPLPWTNMKLTINPSVSAGHGMSRELTKLADMNGDGFPDFVTSSKDDNLTVSTSTIGRTNMLKSVKRPLGASFSVDYERIGNTYDLPNSMWVLSEVTVYDGFKGDGVDTLRTTFAYEGGKHDRHEREFYGFKKVITTSHDTEKNNAPYTRVTQEFNTDNYYEKGLLVNEIMTDADGNKYVEKQNTYQLLDITTGSVLPTSIKADDKGNAFPAVTETRQLFYEGQSTAGKSTATTFGYDKLGNVTRFVDMGDEAADDDLTAVITYHSVADKYIMGSPKSIIVNGNGKVVRKRESVIDPTTGDVKEIKQYLTDSEFSQYNLEYDQYGNLIKITRPANSEGKRLSVNYEYDNKVQTYTTRVNNTYGYSSEATYDLRFGQVLQSTDLNGNKITYEVDDLGRVKSVTGPYENGGANKTIEFEYHPEAEIPWALTNHYDPANPKNKMQTSIFVDGVGRVLQTKKDIAVYDGEGKPDVEQVVVSGKVLFDAFGRATKAWYPVTENVGTPGKFNTNVDAVDPTTTTYDVLNRTLTVVLPDKAKTETAYGFATDNKGKKQFSTKTTDANGKQTEQFTDVRGRVSAVKNYTSEKDIWTSFVYNAINEQIEATDDLGHTTFSSYDNFGRRTERKHPDAGVTTYSYDLAGNLTQLETANLREKGQAIQYKYDYERLTEIQYPEHTENNVKYTYGEPGAPYNRAGRIVLQEDATGAQEFFYGPLGEVVKNIRTVVIPQFDAQTYTTEWTYDTWNRLTSMTYADGEKVEYTYNVGGLLRSMEGKKKSATFNYVQQLGYDKFEQRVFLANGNGTKTTYEYEADRRRLKNMTAQTSGKRLFMDNVYTYDKVNNILSLTNKAPLPANNLMGGQSEYSYSYDDLYRLTTATGGYKGANDEHTYTLAMAYNSVGGITQKTQNHLRKNVEEKKTTYNMSYTYSEEQPHAPTHIGEQTYTYDANGNQTGWTHDVSGQKRKLMWDEENRIRSIANNGAFYHYIYDASGERVLKGQSYGQSAYVDGEWKAGSGNMGNYTVYVNPYIVLKSGGYTKHYYIEGQRIVSKLGGGWDNNGQGPLNAGGDKVDYNGKQQRVFDGIVKNLKFLGQDGSILTAGKSGKVPPGQIIGSSNTAESDRYFYHPDHLGSTSYITDASGEVYQHMEYFAFGETFVEEHSNTDRTPYKFNGKELDEETGLYYYGARYYDARTSVFISVDRFAEKYTSLTPYHYAANNPIIYIDINGDSLGVDKSISGANEAGLKQFASTKEGMAYLSKYAAKGQTLFEHTFTEDGEYHKKGIDLTYDAEKLRSARGNTDYTKIVEGRLKLNITLNTENVDNLSDNSLIFGKAKTVFHESFIHGDLASKDFVDNGLVDFSNLSKDAQYSGNPLNYQHDQVKFDFYQNRYESKNLWPLAAYRGLSQINKNLGLNMTGTQILQRMWGYSGGIELDGKGKVTK